MAITSIVNDTPSRLKLNGLDEYLQLAPLQELPVSDVSAFDFDEAKRQGLIHTIEDSPSNLIDNIQTITLGGGFWVVLIGFWVASIEPPWGLSPTSWVWLVWGTAATLIIGTAGIVIVRGTNSAALVKWFVVQAASFAMILAIGFGLPAASIYFFGDGRQIILASPQPLALFGRLIQLSFIATASLLPVLLYFLFDQFKLGTLRKRLYANLFRLDQSLRTVGDIHAKYGSQISEAYGSEERGRNAPGSRGPVLVCAFVFTVGWIIALLPVGAGFDPQNRVDVLAALVPQQTALVYGFMGVYFFSLRLIAIRYARGDLKPKAYTSIVVRVLVVAVLSWVLDAFFDGESRAKLVLAFLFGIAPDSFFTWLKEASRGVLPEVVFPQQTKLPLTDLEGIDLYDLGRLESEGIVNIEGLAHHELIDLIIDTRVPVPRLIDWVDQAILYLHLTEAPPPTDARTILRNYGIRTATDLLRAWEEAKNRGSPEFESFKNLLGGEKDKLYRLEVIRDTLLDDEWLAIVGNWRKNIVRDPIEVDATPSDADSLERFAQKEMDAHRYGRALDALQRALAKEETASIRLKLAAIYASATVTDYIDPKKAHENADRAFVLAPGSFDACMSLARIYVSLKEYDSAQTALERAGKIVSFWEKSTAKDEAEKAIEDRRKELLVLNPGKLAAVGRGGG